MQQHRTSAPGNNGARPSLTPQAALASPPRTQRRDAQQTTQHTRHTRAVRSSHCCIRDAGTKAQRASGAVTPTRTHTERHAHTSRQPMQQRANARPRPPRRHDGQRLQCHGSGDITVDTPAHAPQWPPPATDVVTWPCHCQVQRRTAPCDLVPSHFLSATSETKTISLKLTRQNRGPTRVEGGGRRGREGGGKIAHTTSTDKSTATHTHT
jgi:hypothetical protein